jgi:hypothetical protein
MTIEKGGPLGASSDPEALPPTASITDINKSSALQCIPRVAFGMEGITEIRAFRGDDQKSVGFFDNEDALVRTAMQLDHDGWNVYRTLNPVSPLLLSRAPNRMGSKTATKAPDILKRSSVLIDLDPERPKGCSATDAG